VEVSPELAKERGIDSGRWVELTSRYGEVRVQAVVTERVKGMEMYMPMNSVEEPVNVLTSSCTDKATHTPAYKETSVQMKVLPEQGRIRCRGRIRDSGIRRRRAEWKWSASGSARITTNPVTGWCRSSQVREGRK
jgi:predicted molibdopterin-dependent oxidoreductase YjgC